MKIDNGLLNESFSLVQRCAEEYHSSNYEYQVLIDRDLESGDMYRHWFQETRHTLPAGTSYKIGCQVDAHVRARNLAIDMIEKYKRDVTFEEYQTIFFNVLTSRFLDTTWEL